jgi:hypothetical protein
VSAFGYGLRQFRILLKSRTIDVDIGDRQMIAVVLLQVAIDVAYRLLQRQRWGSAAAPARVDDA